VRFKESVRRLGLGGETMFVDEAADDRMTGGGCRVSRCRVDRGRRP
jgi:hypothetical protein